MSRVLRPCLLSTLLLTCLSACLPIPNLHTDLKLPPPVYRTDPRSVATAYMALSGFAAPGTPERLNRTFYLRYYKESRADTILVLMPGIFGGATNFDILARQLVASQPGLEVWAIDRRANALEDHSALRESLLAREPGIAYRYYEQEAGTDAGFKPIPENELGFMRRWGLVTHLYDLHEVVKRAHEQAATVILGGHSLGASIVSLYAAYRFEDGPGDDTLDGLLLLDGTLGRTGSFGITGGLTLGELELIPNALGYDAGRGAPFLATPLGPNYYAASEARTLLARFRPNALAPDTSFPMTNLARIGSTADEGYALSAIFATSLGEPVGARFGGNLPAVFIDGWDSHSSRTIAGVADGFEAVTWADDGDAREFTDLDAYLRARVTLATDWNEWYFPLRLLVDMSELPLDLSETPDFEPHSQVRVPTLAVGAGRGLVSSLDGFSAYSNLRASALFSSYVIPGFTHLDLVSAHDNPLVPLTERWLDQIGALEKPANP